VEPVFLCFLTGNSIFTNIPARNPSPQTIGPGTLPEGLQAQAGEPTAQPTSECVCVPVGVRLCLCVYNACVSAMTILP
jgi:hypothetical protein